MEFHKQIDIDVYIYLQNTGVKQYRNEKHVIIPKPSKLPYYYIHKQNNKIQFSDIFLNTRTPGVFLYLNMLVYISNIYLGQNNLHCIHFVVLITTKTQSQE